MLKNTAVDQFLQTRRQREIPIFFWKSSKRLTPENASRKMSKLPHSPIRSTERAKGQLASAQLFRCIQTY
ncbi:hypothetical protein CQ10_18825 [Bradyrhizobium valentinum]|nr:hypothetical protein CQ10_18825 [Bradyrhizobium valentinum]